MLPTRFYFDNALDQLFGNEGSKMMNCDIYEKDNTYHVEMDLPGFKKDEIKVECNKGNLVITAEKSSNFPESIISSISSSSSSGIFIPLLLKYFTPLNS